MENQAAGQSVANILAKRGWSSSDNRVFTKDNMTIQKAAGNKFAKWHLEVDGKEALVEGELNFAIGVAQGLGMAAGTPAPAPKPERVKQPKMVKPSGDVKPAVRLDEVDTKPGWTMNDEDL